MMYRVLCFVLYCMLYWLCVAVCAVRARAAARARAGSGRESGGGARHGHGSRTPRLRRGESGYSGPQRRSGGSERRAAGGDGGRGTITITNGVGASFGALL